MQIHAKNVSRLRKQRGAFLILALILIVVLAALGISLLSETVASTRTGKYYSKAVEAYGKAQSAAFYADRILNSYPDGKYPGPATCTSSATCTIVDATFPHSGRPTFAWTSGLGSVTLVGASEPKAWWQTNGFAYENTYLGTDPYSAVIVSRVSSDPSDPYKNTYRVVGYGLDSSGSTRTTYELFHTWKGFPADPGDATCAGGCNYGQCCSDTDTCASDQTSCEAGTAAYTPPGWTCSEYFVTGLGYAGTTCDNIHARIADTLPAVYTLTQRAIKYSQENGHFPSSADLGFPGATDQFANPVDAVGTYGTSFAMFDFDSTYNGGADAGCGRAGYIVYTLDPTALGFGVDVDLVQLECSIYHVSGEFYTDCGYVYGLDGVTSKVETLGLAGFVNGNTTTAWDYSALPSTTSAHIATSTCQ